MNGIINDGEYPREVIINTKELLWKILLKDLYFLLLLLLLYRAVVEVVVKNQRALNHNQLLTQHQLLMLAVLKIFKLIR